MLVGAPLVEAEQNSSIGIEDLPKVIMGRKGSRLTEQRLVPFEAVRHVAYSYDRPRALHRVPLLRTNSCLDRPERVAHPTVFSRLWDKSWLGFSIHTLATCPTPSTPLRRWFSIAEWGPNL